MVGELVVDRSRKLLEGEKPGDRKEYSLWFGAEGRDCSVAVWGAFWK